MIRLFFDNIINNIPRIIKFLRGNNLFFRLTLSCPRHNLGNRGASFTVNPEIINPGDIVYSFGIGNDISFDLQMIGNYNVKVFAFDPTPKSVSWLSEQKLPANFKAFPVGIANYTGEADFFLPENENFVSASMVSRQSESVTRVKVKRLSDIMKELGHSSIDVLKMDVEGAEYDVIDDIIESGIMIRQVLIEFHHRFLEDGTKKTRDSIKKLKKAGYRLFYVSPMGEEFSFLKQDPAI